MIKKLFLTASVFLLFLFSAQATYAAFWDDLLGGAKKLVAPEKSATSVTVDSSITLAPSGDLDKNNQIDAGDTLIFIYVISNPTKNTLQAITLKTHVDAKKLNSLRNVKGTLNLDVKDDSIVIPNIRVEPYQKRAIRFEARVNFRKEEDVQISTEAELVDNNNSSIIKAEKKEVKAKGMNQKTFDKFVHITKQ